MLIKGQKTVQIEAAPPRVLSVSEAEQSPTILALEDGYINRLTPEDAFEFSKLLRSEALRSKDMIEARTTAKEGFEKFFTSMFNLQGLDVVFNYTDGPKSLLQIGKPEISN